MNKITYSDTYSVTIKIVIISYFWGDQWTADGWIITIYKIHSQQISTIDNRSMMMMMITTNQRLQHIENK